jgi:hypothetical protein
MLSEEYGHRSRFVFDPFPSGMSSLRQEAEFQFCRPAAACPTFCQSRCRVPSPPRSHFLTSFSVLGFLAVSGSTMRVVLGLLRSKARVIGCRPPSR